VPNCEVIHPSELGPGEFRAWSSLQAAAPEFGNPLLGADFAALVGELRADARVAIWRDGRRAAGFLGFHRTVGGFARPIGAPFSDYHALVSAPGRTRVQLDLADAGLQGVRLTGLLDPHGVFDQRLETVVAHQIDLSAGSDAYLSGLWQASRNRWRNFKRYSRRLVEELGPLRIEALDLSQPTFASLMAWKRRQLAATGLHDFTTSPWVTRLFRRLFETPDPDFGGLMISLYAGDRPVAAHFGVRQGDWYHPWIGAYDPELASFSPGIVHQVMAAEAAEGLGVRIYDLGPRADHSKSMFANSSTIVRQGLVTGGGLQARVAVASERMLGPHGRLSFLGHVRNRWDQVSAVELGPGGRIAGIARAAGALHRRIDAWPRPA
jgi:CelD/BcsL family acetyltransferase involved in cellulose biosynthesis